jgi:tetratricopeptide (TPR) repeat protein
MSNGGEIGQSEAEDVPPYYWLNVCNGIEAAGAFLQASSNEERLEAFSHYPILVLEEFPAALQVLADAQSEATVREALVVECSRLRRIQGRILAQYQEWYVTLCKNCGILLAQENQGDPRVNLLRAIGLFQACRDLSPVDTLEYAYGLVNEGAARANLAKLDLNARANLDEAIRLYSRARAIYSRDSEPFAQSLRQEGSARRNLAELGVNAETNLQEAIRLHQEARNIVPPDSVEFAYNLLDEGERMPGVGAAWWRCESNPAEGDKALSNQP